MNQLGKFKNLKLQIKSFIELDIDTPFRKQILIESVRCCVSIIGVIFYLLDL